MTAAPYSRNLSTHTYDEAVALEVEGRIVGIYFELFRQVAVRLQDRINEN